MSELISLPKQTPEDVILSEIVTFRKTGLFTPIITEIIQTKRHEYNISVSDTSVLLGITTQTFFNWWNGTTRRCNLIHRERIIRFISGQLDYLLKIQQDKNSHENMEDIDWQFSHVYKFRRQTRQLVKFFHFTLSDPELNRMFLEKLDKLCKNSIKMMNARKTTYRSTKR